MDIQNYFSKLHVNSILELALIVPKRYEDYRIHTQIDDRSSMVLDATIINIRRTPSSLQLDLFAHNLGFTMQGVIFRPKPYMLHQFSKESRIYLYGKVECKNGRCSIHMPKKIAESSIGQITPIYKTTVRNDIFKKLISKTLTSQALYNEGLDDLVVHNLMSIHFPKQISSELTPKQIYALKYTEMFHYLKELQKKRVSFQSLTSTVTNIQQWIETLPFQLTADQKSAIDDISHDLTQTTAARRMVVGDVGSGKTIVILASAMLNASHRSILMAPTTILAQQLYEEAKKLAPKLKTILITNKTKKELPLQEYNFIIGTHALLYRALPEASLVMVDEQHRFGTKQRNLLSKLVETGEKKPHFIQFSATPIPRTQAMIESAYIDVSLITSTPFKKDITTQVIHKKDFKDLLTHIRNEIAKNNQILIIYPLVTESDTIEYQSIDQARGYWEKNFSNVYVTHGKDKDKELILEKFRESGDILIATTVVEVGISLPRLSTVVIVGAERLGLSTLHQLRGRVSRTGLKGYCFLYTNKEQSKRLEEFCTTTNGFDIAQMDLKYRQSGDLLKGDTQSGKEFQWIDMAEDEKIIKKVKQDLHII